MIKFNFLTSAVLISLTLSLFIMFSCANKEISSVEDTNEIKVVDCDDNFITAYDTTDIKFDIFKHRNYFPDKLVNDDIIKFLFPGTVYKTGDERLGLFCPYLTCWKSTATQKMDFSDRNKDNATFFPLDINFTFLTSKFSFANSGGDFFFYFFNTYEYPCSCIRFSGGYAGVAIFKSLNNNYSLEAFYPAFDCIGNWGFAPDPTSVLDLGKGYFGIFYEDIGEHMKMEDYDPYFGSMKLYSVVENQIVMVLDENWTLCKNWDDNSGTEWNSDLVVLDSSSNNGRNDIQIIMIGKYDPENQPEYFYENFPIEKKELSFNFKIIKTYYFENYKYTLKNNQVIIF